MPYPPLEVVIARRTKATIFSVTTWHLQFICRPAHIDHHCFQLLTVRPFLEFLQAFAVFWQRQPPCARSTLGSGYGFSRTECAAEVEERAFRHAPRSELDEGFSSGGSYQGTASAIPNVPPKNAGASAPAVLQRKRCRSEDLHL